MLTHINTSIHTQRHKYIQAHTHTYKQASISTYIHAYHQAAWLTANQTGTSRGRTCRGTDRHTYRHAREMLTPNQLGIQTSRDADTHSERHCRTPEVVQRVLCKGRQCGLLLSHGVSHVVSHVVTMSRHTSPHCHMAA